MSITAAQQSVTRFGIWNGYVSRDNLLFIREASWLGTFNSLTILVNPEFLKCVHLVEFGFIHNLCIVIGRVLLLLTIVT